MSTRFSSRPLLLAAALALAATPALAQEHGEHGSMSMPESGLRAELIRDVERLEGRYVALAQAMTGKFGWRPAAGVRSASEVFMHVAGANFMLPTMVGVAPPSSFKTGSSMQEAMAAMQALEKETDEAKVIEALKHGMKHARHAIAMTPEDQLDAPTKLFGQDATKRAVLVLLVAHMHEHLGQSIAYARSNGVVPPWSAGGE